MLPSSPLYRIIFVHLGLHLSNSACLDSSNQAMEKSIFLMRHWTEQHKLQNVHCRIPPPSATCMGTLWTTSLFSLKCLLLEHAQSRSDILIIYMLSCIEIPFQETPPLKGTWTTQKFMSDWLKLWATRQQLVAYHKYVFHLLITLFIFQEMNYNVYYKEHINTIKPAIF